MESHRLAEQVLVGVSSLFVGDVQRVDRGLASLGRLLRGRPSRGGVWYRRRRCRSSIRAFASHRFRARVLSELSDSSFYPVARTREKQRVCKPSGGAEER